MSVRNGLFSSESVSEGHPDKLADRISDAVLDEFLRHDPSARVACETLLADQCVVVAGEFKTRSPETFRAVRERAVTIVSDVLRDAGYRDGATGIDPERCEIQVRFNGQSADINQGVDREDGVIGAGRHERSGPPARGDRGDRAAVRCALGRRAPGAEGDQAAAPDAGDAAGPEGKLGAAAGAAALRRAVAACQGAAPFGRP